MMNNISWRSIRAFLYVANHGSFTAAADAAGMSKANLSQQVSALEAQLGVQLLVRTTRNLSLTEVGEGYFQRCEQAMQQLDAAAEWATEATSRLAGTIRMNSVGGLIGEDLVAPIVIAFQKAHPDIQVHLDFSSVKVDLIEKHYDLVLRMGELQDSSLIARKLTTIRTMYVASPEFVARNPPIRKPEDLAKMPLISGSVDHWILVNGSDRRMVHVQNGLRMRSGRAMRRAVLEGLGISRLPDVYIQNDLRAEMLVEVLPNWSEETPLYLLSPPHQYQLHRVKALADFLKPELVKAYKRIVQDET